MKILSNILWQILAKIARLVIKRHQPLIIWITGSVGKTSTRNVIYQVLSKQFGTDNIYAQEENYNGEWGLPLSIIRQRTAWKNIFKWIIILIKGFGVAFNSHYPKIIILEYGLDHLGEMEKMLSVAKPHIAIITKIAPVHTLQMGDVQNIAQEKSKIAKYLTKDDFLILNADDPMQINLGKEVEAKVFYYGCDSQFKPEYDHFFLAKEIVQGIKGTDFSLEIHSVQDKKKSILVRKETISTNLLGKYQLYTILPALVIAYLQKIKFEEIKPILQQLELVPGRMSLLDGINGSKIVDSSYNCSPTALCAILAFFKEQTGYKILLVGDMRELGTIEKQEHQKIAANILDTNVNQVITVGPAMKNYMVPKLLELGASPEIVTSFLDSAQAGDLIRKIVGQQKNSLVLVKGSQNTIWLENAIVKFMAEPEKAKELLVVRKGGLEK